MSRMKRTKIVATISTMNCEVDFLRRLHAAGMDVARLNTAHMSLEDAALIDSLKKLLRFFKGLKEMDD